MNTKDTPGDCCSMDTSKNSHWNKAYTDKETEKLGWYEKEAKPTLDLIKDCNLPKDTRILNVGVGTTTLIDDLISEGYSNLIATDLSEKALEILKERCGTENVSYIQDDLTNSTTLNTISQVDLWNDRAVLHFFLKEEEKQAYFDLLKKVVKIDGFVIIATFNLNGALKCCGLDLCRYDKAMIAERLGEDFELVKDFDHTFINPAGSPREYVYTLFQRKK
ncbi:class I SAM-dependent methyltransferase [Aureivirga marina]|uniref:class I SAM-dependent methyltransferase n=1 Tax=Aureivirga marina TaxID=1182451 RepID=UPI001E3A0CD9|nr:methyltransferase domain-containing protein [Aureivirga marina]